MEELPTELIEKIFLHLRRPDRLSAALVCKRWSEIVSTSRSLRDISLVLRVADLHRVTPILLDSCRQYPNLKILNGKLSERHAEFWSRIAGDLVSLQLEKCEILDAELFYAILEGCQKLQSLELTDCGRVASFDILESECPEKVCVAKVQQSLRNVRHLSLRTNQFLTDASFDRMLTLMPNITSLHLAGCKTPIFAPGTRRTIGFNPPNLTFPNVLDCMVRSKQEFVDLDFSSTLITDQALIPIVGLYRESLRSLRLDRCNRLTTRAYEAIGDCSKLRLLSLNSTSQINDDNLERILRKTTDLEYLDLGFCSLISNQSLQRIAQLNKLRHLNLSGGRDPLWQIRLLSWGSLRTLTGLQHLDLSYTDCDREALRQLASLRDLRTLELRECFKLNSYCFQIICDSFKRLEELNLNYSPVLHDGCEFHQLKHLRVLDISGLVRISDRSLENGIGAPDMKTLTMAHCSWLKDRALVSIANNHVCLEYLDISGCFRITDVGLITVVRCLPLLRTLILKGCRWLTDQSLNALQDQCTHLRKLNVEDCRMSGDAIDLFAHLRPIVDIIWGKSVEATTISLQLLERMLL